MKIKVPYVIKKTLRDGTVMYYFNPPRDAVKAGIVSAKPLGADLEKEVYPEAKRLNMAIDAWRGSTPIQVRPIVTKNNLRNLVTDYMASDYFKKLSPVAKCNYRGYLLRLCEFTLKNSKQTLGDMEPDSLRRSHADQLYAHAKEEYGPHAAIKFVAACRRLYDIGLKWERCTTNPWIRMELVKPKSRTMRWTYDQIETFVKKAIEVNRKSIAILALLAFETGQRIGDVIPYRWSQYEEGCIKYIQSKTGKPMRTPIEASLRQLLDKLRPELEPKSSYICANEITGTLWSPKSLQRHVARIKKLADLPDNLWLMDLRRTAVTEAEDAGVTEGEGMAMSGHTTRTSYAVYAVVTDNRVDTALQKRWALREQRLNKVGLAGELISSLPAKGSSGV